MVWCIVLSHSSLQANLHCGRKRQKYFVSSFIREPFPLPFPSFNTVFYKTVCINLRAVARYTSVILSSILHGSSGSLNFGRSPRVPRIAFLQSRITTTGVARPSSPGSTTLSHMHIKLSLIKATGLESLV